MRQGDEAKLLPARGAVQRGRFHSVLRHRLQARVKHDEGKGQHMPHAVQNDQEPCRPGLGHPEHLHAELRQHMRHQAVVTKEPLDGQRAHHRRDDEGQQRGGDEKAAQGVRRTLHRQRERQATYQDERRRDQRVDQRELQRGAEFVVRIGLAAPQAQHLAVVVGADKSAALHRAAAGVHARALRHDLLRTKGACLLHGGQLKFWRAVAHREPRGHEQWQGQQRQHEQHRGRGKVDEAARLHAAAVMKAFSAAARR